MKLRFGIRCRFADNRLDFLRDFVPSCESFTETPAVLPQAKFVLTKAQRRSIGAIAGYAPIEATEILPTTRLAG